MQTDVAAEIQFGKSDCALFERYPKSINFNEVSAEDKDHYRSIRTKLKTLVAEASERWSQKVPMQSHASVLSPNGRNPPDLWCCLFPRSAPNKSFSLQIATIISSRGCELCFCLGAGTAQVKDPGEIQRNKEALERLRVRLRELPKEQVQILDKTLGKTWQYRRQWRQDPHSEDFTSLTDWLSFASSSSGDGASISRNISPDELEAIGGKFAQLFEDSVQLFMPLIEEVYSDWDSAETEQEDADVISCLKAIRNLRVDKEDGVPRLYKPAVIYSIVEALDRRELTENIITFDWLVPRFIETMWSLGKESDERQAAAAFFHLKSEEFWNLEPNPNMNLPVRGEPAQIRKLVHHAYFSDEFWSVLANDVHRKKIRNVILNHWFAEAKDVHAGLAKSFNYESASRALIDDINGLGFNFEPWQIACYLVALRTKPFLILGGVSGTGKSQLPLLVAEKTGVTAELVPVRPDWTDSSDILGYIDLQGQLRPGPLLKIAEHALKDPDHYFVCVVDEMNLARVEHYFAEVLSRLEEARASGNSGRLLTHTLSPKDQHWSSVTLPRNVAVVGTVNMDESTHGFSKKVIDRAFTIEFSEIDLSVWEMANKSLPGGLRWPNSAWMPRAARPGAIVDLPSDDRAEVQRVISTLIELNTILSQAQLQLGYRSRDEIAMFVLHSKELADLFVTRHGDAVDPLDLAIQMKVLPRIAGGTRAIRRLVLQLLGWATSTTLRNDDDASGVLSEWWSSGRANSLGSGKFPRTAARLCLMWERILNEGFTSFWL